jgi:Dolichyl-phosphate-mannose-protein mannosyltransferase
LNRSIPTAGPPVPNQRDWCVLSFFLGVIAYLCANVFLLRGVPILLGGDQVYFWMEAQRLAAGEKIYRDFLQFTPPGAELVFLGFFRVFGQRIWVTNAVVALLGIALCWVCFRLACKIMRPRLALLATVLFLVLIYGKVLTATHHFFSVLLCMIATLVFRPEQSRIALAGLFLGLAAFFTQTHAVAVLFAFAIYLIVESIRRRVALKTLLFDQAILFLVFACVLLLLDFTFLSDVGLREVWYWQVTYARSYVSGAFAGTFLGIPVPFAWRTLPSFGQYLSVCFLPLIVCPLALWLSWRRRDSSASPEMPQVLLLSLVGLSLFLEVTNKPNWLRFYAIAMPSVALLVWVISQARRQIARPLVILAWTAAILLALQQTWSRQRHNYVIATLPAGAAAVDSNAFLRLNAVLQRTQPGDYFFQAIWPGLYFPLQLRNPLYVDTVWPNEESRPEFIDLAIRQLDLHPTRYILWSHSIDGPEPAKQSSDHLPPLRAYLRDHYRAIEEFPDGAELWERK